MIEEAQAGDETGEAAAAETGGAGEAPESNTIEVPEEYRTPDGQADVAKLLEALNTATAPKEGAVENPDAYALDLAEEIKGPDGEPVKVDPDNPLLKDFRALAHEAGVDQPTFSKLLTAYVKDQVSQAQTQQEQMIEAGRAEIAKLGDKATDRMKAVDDWIVAKAPKEFAPELIKSLNSAAAYQAIEAIIRAVTPAKSPNGASQGLSNVPSQEKSIAERIYGKSMNT